jgi:hypothetical protein
LSPVNVSRLRLMKAVFLFVAGSIVGHVVSRVCLFSPSLDIYIFLIRGEQEGTRKARKAHALTRQRMAGANHEHSPL